MKPLHRELLISLVLLTAIAALLAWYSIAQRSHGDVVVAEMAVESLATELTLLQAPTETALGLSEIMRLEEEVVLFLGSDSARRLPRVARPIGRADIAIQGALELRLLADRGVVSPTLAEAPATAVALATFPETGTLLVGTGAAATVDNRDSRASKALVEIAAGEFSDAARELGFTP